MLEILEFLHATQRAIGIGDLAEGVNAPRSTTYTLVRSLVDAVSSRWRRRQQGRFRQELYLYGLDYVRGNDLGRRGRQEAADLSRENGETSEICACCKAGRYTIVGSSPGTSAVRIAQPPACRSRCHGRHQAGRFGRCGRTPSRTWCRKTTFCRRWPPAAALRFHRRYRHGQDDQLSHHVGLVDAYTKCLAAPVFSVTAGRGDDVPGGPDRHREGKTDELIALLRERAARL